MNSRHCIKEMSKMTSAGMKRLFQCPNVGFRMTNRHDPAVFDQVPNQIDPTFNLGCERRHVNTAFQSRQLSTVRCPLSTFKVLRPQGTAHLFIRKNALVMNTDSLCNRPPGLQLHQLIDLTSNAPIILSRIRYQIRHPSRNTVLRKKRGYLQQALSVGIIYVNAHRAVNMDVDVPGI